MYISGDDDKQSVSEESKNELKKPLHTIAEIVKNKEPKRSTSSPCCSDSDLAGSAFHIHTPRQLSSFELWKQQHIFLPSLYSFPMTPTSYHHLTARQMSSALALRCQGDSRFCSS